MAVPSVGVAVTKKGRPDASPASGAPSAAPEYYALLLFSRFAQNTHGLRPAPVLAAEPHAAAIKAWRTGGGNTPQRLFVINKGAQPTKVDVAIRASSYDAAPHGAPRPGR